MSKEAATMYKEIIQGEDVPRGYIKLIQIIPYDKAKVKKIDVEKNKVVMVDTEIGRRSYFCQDKEDLLIFKENNPEPRLETHDVQVLKSTAVKYLNDPENMKEFVKKEEKNG